MLIAAALLITAALLIATTLLGIVAIVVTGTIASLLSTRLKSASETLGPETCFIVMSFAAVGSLSMNAGPLRPTATLVT